jgi:hypothetical protein
MEMEMAMQRAVTEPGRPLTRPFLMVEQGALFVEKER